MSLHERIGGFNYAWKGVKIGWREEANFRFHFGAAVAAVVLGVLLAISAVEWAIILLAIGVVMSAELLNTALEELCDMYKTDRDPHIEKIKDVAAGAVYLASIAALLVGIAIFVPRFLSLF